MKLSYTVLLASFIFSFWSASALPVSGGAAIDVYARSDLSLGDEILVRSDFDEQEELLARGGFKDLVHKVIGKKPKTLTHEQTQKKISSIQKKMTKATNTYHRESAKLRPANPETGHKGPHIKFVGHATEKDKKVGLALAHQHWKTTDNAKQFTHGEVHLNPGAAAGQRYQHFTSKWGYSEHKMELGANTNHLHYPESK